LKAGKADEKKMERNIQFNWQSLVIEAIKHCEEQNLTAVLFGVSRPALNSFEKEKTGIKILKALGLAY
jgi:hypothetical protein